MIIDGKTYTLAQLRKKMPIYDMFFPVKVQPNSHEDQLDKDPIGTTNPNLHLRFDPSEVVKRGESELFDRKYLFLGLVGTKMYACVETFTHDEEDTELVEIP